jgi:hypothetical protein
MPLWLWSILTLVVIAGVLYLIYKKPWAKKIADEVGEGIDKVKDKLT